MVSRSHRIYLRRAGVGRRTVAAGAGVERRDERQVAENSGGGGGACRMSIVFLILKITVIIQENCFANS